MYRHVCHKTTPPPEAKFISCALKLRFSSFTSYIALVPSRETFPDNCLSCWIHSFTENNTMFQSRTSASHRPQEVVRLRLLQHSPSIWSACPRAHCQQFSRAIVPAQQLFVKRAMTLANKECISVVSRYIRDDVDSGSQLPPPATRGRRGFRGRRRLRLLSASRND